MIKLAEKVCLAQNREQKERNSRDHRAQTSLIHSFEICAPTIILTHLGLGLGFKQIRRRPLLSHLHFLHLPTNIINCIHFLPYLNTFSLLSFLFILFSPSSCNTPSSTSTISHLLPFTVLLHNIRDPTLLFCLKLSLFFCLVFKRKKMKFMKLGSKPDAFQSDGKFVRLVSCSLLFLSCFLYISFTLLFSSSVSCFFPLYCWCFLTVKQQLNECQFVFNCFSVTQYKLKWFWCLVSHCYCQ